MVFACTLIAPTIPSVETDGSETKFLKMFDLSVRKNQNIGEIKPLLINNSRFKIYFDKVIRTN